MKRHNIITYISIYKRSLVKGECWETAWKCQKKTTRQLYANSRNLNLYVLHSTFSSDLLLYIGIYLWKCSVNRSWLVNFDSLILVSYLYSVFIIPFQKFPWIISPFQFCRKTEFPISPDSLIVAAGSSWEHLGGLGFSEDIYICIYVLNDYWGLNNFTCKHGEGTKGTHWDFSGTSKRGTVFAWDD